MPYDVDEKIGQVGMSQQLPQLYAWVMHGDMSDEYPVEGRANRLHRAAWAETAGKHVAQSFYDNLFGQTRMKMQGESVERQAELQEQLVMDMCAFVEGSLDYWRTVLSARALRHSQMAGVRVGGRDRQRDEGDAGDRAASLVAAGKCPVRHKDRLLQVPGST
ncbi:hypothetical protein PG991_006450 [Apiospora marii]|uniref:Uncharacterized protein n=1 Tax=Apiospora marii TaxID=335849 RepID=A0ABR1S0Q9_9PEZI